LAVVILFEVGEDEDVMGMALLDCCIGEAVEGGAVEEEAEETVANELGGGVVGREPGCEMADGVGGVKGPL